MCFIGFRAKCEHLLIKSCNNPDCKCDTEKLNLNEIRSKRDYYKAISTKNIFNGSEEISCIFSFFITSIYIILCCKTLITPEIYAHINKY